MADFNTPPPSPSRGPANRGAPIKAGMNSMVRMQPESMYLSKPDIVGFINDFADGDCSICLDPLRNGEPVCMLVHRNDPAHRCGHMFHNHCIDQLYAAGDEFCPNCQYRIDEVIKDVYLGNTAAFGKKRGNSEIKYLTSLINSH